MRKTVSVAAVVVLLAACSLGAAQPDALDMDAGRIRIHIKPLPEDISRVFLAFELELFLYHRRLIPSVERCIGLQVGHVPATCYHQRFPAGHLQCPVQLGVARLAVVPG